MLLSIMMQLKTVGESLDALNEITGILNGNLLDIGTSETALSAIGEKYHLFLSVKDTKDNY